MSEYTNLTVAQIEKAFLAQSHQTRDFYKFVVELANVRRRKNFVTLDQISIEQRPIFCFSFLSLSERFYNSCVYLNPSIGTFRWTINKRSAQC